MTFHRARTSGVWKKKRCFFTALVRSSMALASGPQRVMKRQSKRERERYRRMLNRERLRESAHARETDRERETERERCGVVPCMVQPGRCARVAQCAMYDEHHTDPSSQISACNSIIIFSVVCVCVCVCMCLYLCLPCVSFVFFSLFSFFSQPSSSPSPSLYLSLSFSLYRSRSLSLPSLLTSPSALSGPFASLCSRSSPLFAPRFALAVYICPHLCSNALIRAANRRAPQLPKGRPIA